MARNAERGWGSKLLQKNFILLSVSKGDDDTVLAMHYTMDRGVSLVASLLLSSGVEGSGRRVS